MKIQGHIQVRVRNCTWSTCTSLLCDTAQDSQGVTGLKDRVQAKANRQGEKAVHGGDGDEVQKAFAPDLSRDNCIDDREKNQRRCNGLDHVDDWLADVAKKTGGGSGGNASQNTCRQGNYQPQRQIHFQII